MLLKDNLLLFKKNLDFTTKDLNKFFNRLRLFLLIDFDAVRPRLKLATNKEQLREHGDDDNDVHYNACYDHETHTVVFNTQRYHTGDNFAYTGRPFILPEYEKQYRYIIPLSDVYHELLHHIQYFNANYKNTVFIEGSAEILAMVLTGQDNIEYRKESIALWNLARNVLKLDIYSFYTLIAKMVVNASYPNKVLFHNTLFLKILNKEFDDNVIKFLRSIKTKFGKLSLETAMKTDLIKIHNSLYP